MRSFTRTLALAGLLILGACASTGDAGVPKCTCGTTASAAHGCHNSLCLSGQTNPDNPKCHCGPIVLPNAGNKGN